MAVPLLIQLPSDLPGKAVEGGLSEQNPCHPHGRPEWSFWLQTLALSNPSCWSRLENEPVERISLSSLSFSLSSPSFYLSLSLQPCISINKWVLKEKSFLTGEKVIQKLKEKKIANQEYCIQKRYPSEINEKYWISMTIINKGIYCHKTRRNYKRVLMEFNSRSEM